MKRGRPGAGEGSSGAGVRTQTGLAAQVAPGPGSPSGVALGEDTRVSHGLRPRLPELQWLLQPEQARTTVASWRAAPCGLPFLLVGEY